MKREAAFYFERLYPLQDAALGVISGVETDFYLTGGTAASRGYLQHRFSDDLDFFVDDDDRFGLWADRLIHALGQREVWDLEVSLREARFVRAILRQDVLELKIELINDVPSRVGAVTLHPVLGRLDSSKNILANKITAALGRSEPKDLADIWAFTQSLGLSVSEAIAGAQGKAAGIFPAELARVLYSVTEADWELVRWIDPPSAERFIRDLQQLAESILTEP